MTNNKAFPEWQNQSFWLNKEEIEEPISVLAHFFETYSLPVCRTNLWDLLTGFMNSDLADGLDRHERSDLLFFYQGLSEVLEVSSLLIKKGQNT